MTLTPSISEDFLQLEKDLNLFTIKIADVYFWERIRFGVHQYIFERMAGQPISASSKYSLLEKMKYYLRTIVEIWNYPFLPRRKDILFVNSPRRLQFEDGRCWDIYLDPIIDKLSTSYILIEPDYRLKHSKPAKTKEICHMDIINVIAGIKKALHIGKLELTLKEVKLIRAIEIAIYKQFGINMNLRNIVLNTLQKRKDTLPLHLAFLKRINPKVVVCVCSYGKETLIEAAKILSIPVVELQHGVIYSMHLGYSFCESHATKRTFPDYLLVFGNYWIDVACYPIQDEKVVSVGYPYMEIQKKKHAKTPRKKQILFISQPKIGGSISRFAVSLDERVGGEFDLVFKLHPGELHNWKECYPELLNSNVKVIESKDTSLYRLFAESVIQVGISSTALFEGLAFGLDTFLIEGPSIEFMTKLIESGYAERISETSDLISKLEKRTHLEPFDDTFFFRKDATNNVIAFLNKLIRNEGKS